MINHVIRCGCRFNCSVYMYTFKILVKITQNIRIIDLQKHLRRVCNGIVIEQFEEDYSELLVHLNFESEVNLNDQIGLHK